MVQVDGTDILLVNVDGTVRATQGICSHEYFELDKGFLTGDSLTCALHLSRFDLETGEALDPPAEIPLAVYEVAVEDGEIALYLPEGPIPGQRVSFWPRAGPHPPQPFDDVVRRLADRRLWRLGVVGAPWPARQAEYAVLAVDLAMNIEAAGASVRAAVGRVDC